MQQPKKYIFNPEMRKELDKMKCIHDKSYSQWMKPTIPPQFDWICRKCGVTGTDSCQRVKYDYDEIRRKFELIEYRKGNKEAHKLIMKRFKDVEKLAKEYNGRK